jgi:hypothetical protein
MCMTGPSVSSGGMRAVGGTLAYEFNHVRRLYCIERGTLVLVVGANNQCKQMSETELDVSKRPLSAGIIRQVTLLGT